MSSRLGIGKSTLHYLPMPDFNFKLQEPSNHRHFLMPDQKNKQQKSSPPKKAQQFPNQSTPSFLHVSKQQTVLSHPRRAGCFFFKIIFFLFYIIYF
jgi:hypothetical protein